MGTFFAGLIAAVLLSALAIIVYDNAHVTVIEQESPPGVHVSHADVGDADKPR